MPGDARGKNPSARGKSHSSYVLLTKYCCFDVPLPYSCAVAFGEVSMPRYSIYLYIHSTIYLYLVMEVTQYILPPDTTRHDTTHPDRNPILQDIFVTIKTKIKKTSEKTKPATPLR